LSILFVDLKPKVEKLFSIEIAISILPLYRKHIYKYWSQAVTLSKLEKGALRDYELVFVYFWHLWF
jgi:hypothetical protein